MAKASGGTTPAAPAARIMLNAIAVVGDDRWGQADNLDRS
jgi:hypothetical protein